MSNEIEIRVTAQNATAPGLRGAVQDARRAGRQAGEGLADETEQGAQSLTTSLQQLGRRAGQRLREAFGRTSDGVADDARDLGEDAGDAFNDGAEDAAGDGGGGGGRGGVFGSILGMARGGIATAALAVGAAAGAAVLAGFKGAMEHASTANKLEAQLADPVKAHKAGQAAGKVYKEGFGESFADVADAARRAIQAGMGGSDEDLRKVTRAAMSLSEAFDVDVRGSMSAAHNLIANGLAKDGPAAFDLIAKAMTNTGDLSDDLIDTIDEYSSQFAAVGVSAPKALGLISQMVKGGARNTDLAADAIKEFAIRSKDGSKTSKEAFEAIGLNANDMFHVFAKGGPAADKAMGDVVQRIKGIKDPMDRALVATALFGTQAEDLQDALYSIDPGAAVAAFGKVGTAAQDMGDTLANDPAKKIERMKRRVMGGLSSFAGGIIGAFEKLGKMEPMKELTATIRKDVMPVFHQVGKYVNDKLVPFFKDVLSQALTEANKAFQRLSQAVKDNAPELKQLYKWFKKVAEYVAEKVGPVIGPMLSHSFSTAINAITGTIMAIGLVVRAFHRMRDGASSAASGVRNRFSSMVSYVRAVPGRIRGALSGAFNALPRSARAAVNSARRILGEILSFARSIPGRVMSTISSGLGGVLSNLPGFAHGGVVGAATGGARSGLIMAGEHGRELIRVPGGSSVIPHGQTERMLQGGGSGGGGVARLELSSDGTRVGDLLVELLRSSIKKRGGNVQVILAGRPA